MLGQHDILLCIATRLSLHGLLCAAIAISAETLQRLLG